MVHGHCAHFVPPRFQIHPVTYPRLAGVLRMLDGKWNKPYRYSRKEDERLAFSAALRMSPCEGFRSWKTHSNRTDHKCWRVEDDGDNFGPFDDLFGLPHPFGLGHPATS